MRVVKSNYPSLPKLSIVLSTKSTPRAITRQGTIKDYGHRTGTKCFPMSKDALRSLDECALAQAPRKRPSEVQGQQRLQNEREMW